MKLSDIVKVITYLSGAGSTNANFGITAAFVDLNDVKTTGDGENQTPVLAAETWHTLSSIEDAAEYFDTTAQGYLMAESHFGASRVPLRLYVMDGDKSVTENLSYARSQAGGWFYHFTLPKTHQQSESTVTAVRTWADGASAGSFFWHTMPAVDADENSTHAKLTAAIKDDGIRHADVLYRQQLDKDSIDDHLWYDCLAGASLFSAINYSAAASNVSMEFKGVSGVTADDLGDADVTYCRANNITMYSVVHEANVVGSGEYLNTLTNSTKGEVVGSVINVDVISSYQRTAAHNWLKRYKLPTLDALRQASLQAAIADLMQQFFAANVIRAGYIENPLTGEKEFCKNGFKIYTRPEQIDERSDAQIAADEFYPISLRYLIAVGGRSITIDNTVTK